MSLQLLSPPKLSRNNKISAISNNPVFPDQLSQHHPMDKSFSSLLLHLSRQESTPLLPIKERSTRINRQICLLSNRSRTHSNPRYYRRAIVTDLSSLTNSSNLERTWCG